MGECRIDEIDVEVIRSTREIVDVAGEFWPELGVIDVGEHTQRASRAGGGGLQCGLARWRSFLLATQRVQAGLPAAMQHVVTQRLQGRPFAEGAQVWVEADVFLRPEVEGNFRRVDAELSHELALGAGPGFGPPVFLVVPRQRVLVEWGQLGIERPVERAIETKDVLVIQVQSMQTVDHWVDGVRLDGHGQTAFNGTAFEVVLKRVHASRFHIVVVGQVPIRIEQDRHRPLALRGAVAVVRKIEPTRGGKAIGAGIERGVVNRETLRQPAGRPALEAFLARPPQRQQTPREPRRRHRPTQYTTSGSSAKEAFDGAQRPGDAP